MLCREGHHPGNLFSRHVCELVRLVARQFVHFSSPARANMICIVKS